MSIDLNDIYIRVVRLEEKIDDLEEQLNKIYNKIKRLHLFLALVFVLREQ